jgi:shikimate kinase
MKNIVLVGFMGTGKTAVAKKLVQGFKLHYLSTDDLIEKRERRKISEIFAKSGEQYFRKIESDIIKDASQKNDLVIDAGGGAVIKEENIKNLKRNGVMICLTATADVILERTKYTKHRPLLNTEEPKKKIEELLFQRAPYYAKADFTIDTSGLSVEQVVKEIEEIVKKENLN